MEEEERQAQKEREQHELESRIREEQKNVIKKNRANI